MLRGSSRGLGTAWTTLHLGDEEAVAEALGIPGSVTQLACIPTAFYTGDDFKALYDFAVANTLPNLEAPNGRYLVTGDEQLDDRLWEAAFERGYELRPTAGDGLSSVAGVPMQPQAADAWVGLRATAREAGMSFIVSSAYRSPAAQRGRS